MKRLEDGSQMSSDMMGDMMIPFIMLLIITIALVLERKYHEDKILIFMKINLMNGKNMLQLLLNKKNIKSWWVLYFWKMKN